MVRIFLVPAALAASIAYANPGDIEVDQMKVRDCQETYRHLSELLRMLGPQVHPSCQQAVIQAKNRCGNVDTDWQLPTFEQPVNGTRDVFLAKVKSHAAAKKQNLNVADICLKEAGHVRANCANMAAVLQKQYHNNLLNPDPMLMTVASQTSVASTNAERVLNSAGDCYIYKAGLYQRAEIEASTAANDLPSLDLAQPDLASQQITGEPATDSSVDQRLMNNIGKGAAETGVETGADAASRSLALAAPKTATGIGALGKSLPVLSTGAAAATGDTQGLALGGAQAAASRAGYGIAATGLGTFAAVVLHSTEANTPCEGLVNSGPVERAGAGCPLNPFAGAQANESAIRTLDGP